MISNEQILKIQSSLVLEACHKFTDIRLMKVKEGKKKLEIG